MALELKKSGKAIDFIIINADNAKDDVANLVSKCSFPIFQDSEKAKIWTSMGGSKDDFYVYDSAGKLAHYLPFGAAKVGTSLGNSKDYSDVKALLLAVK